MTTRKPDQITRPAVKPLPLHPLAEIFPWLEGTARENLRADIKKKGLLETIKTYGGQVIDGKNRQRESIAVGVQPRYEAVDEMLKAKGIHIVDYVRSLNFHRRHLTAKQKREAIKELLKQYPKWSDNRIADTVDADHKTVGAKRREMEGSAEIPKTEKREDRKGHTRPAKGSRPRTARRMPRHPKVPTVIDPNAAITLDPGEHKVETESQNPKVSHDHDDDHDEVGDIVRSAFAAPEPSAAVTAVLRKVVEFITEMGDLTSKDERYAFYTGVYQHAIKARRDLIDTDPVAAPAPPPGEQQDQTVNRKTPECTAKADDGLIRR
jgi:hypothetical protein